MVRLPLHIFYLTFLDLEESLGNLYFVSLLWPKGQKKYHRNVKKYDSSLFVSQNVGDKGIVPDALKYSTISLW